MTRLLCILFVFISQIGFTQTFTVNTKSPIYVGLSKTMSVNVEGVLDDSVYVEVNLGSVTRKEKNQYRLTVDSSGPIAIKVFAIIKLDTVFVGSYKTYVYPLPNPVATFNARKPGTIRRSDIHPTSRLNAIMDVGVIFCGVTPKILSYDIVIYQDDTTTPSLRYNSPTNKLPDPVYTKLKQLMPGDRFEFVNIKCATPTETLYLQPISFTLID